MATSFSQLFQSGLAQVAQVTEIAFAAGEVLAAVLAAALLDVPTVRTLACAIVAGGTVVTVASRLHAINKALPPRPSDAPSQY
jgi:hypothetical protein